LFYSDHNLEIEYETLFHVWVEVPERCFLKALSQN